MRSRLVSCLTLCLAIVSPVLALPAEQYRRTVPAPSDDPFYSPPDGFENEEPGTVLRYRSVATGFFGLILNPVAGYQLLYRTTAINGSAIATVTTVFRPLFAKSDRFVSFHTAYDSSSNTCNPSYNYRLGATQTDLIVSVETLIIEAYLLSGYIVSSPDYEGPEAAFAAGRLAGTGVLDSMRAVTNFGSNLGFSTKSPMIVGVGYSGGGIATGWAASLQPSYAPELPVKGWVQGGVPANLTGTLLTLDNSLFSGFLPPAVAGLSKPSAYGAELSPILEEVITPHGRDIIAFAESHCAVADIISFPYQSILSDEVQTLGSGLLYDPGIVAVLDKQIMGIHADETPTAPVFAYHATQDEIIPYANASTLVDSWCQNGASVTFTTYAAGGHATTEVIALPAALNYVATAFADKAPRGCARNTELADSLDPIALGVNLEPVLIKLLDAVVAAGKEDSNIMSDLQVLSKSISQ